MSILKRSLTALSLTIALYGTLSVVSEHAMARVVLNGASFNGASFNGMKLQGILVQGIKRQNVPSSGNANKPASGFDGKSVTINAITRPKAK